MKETTIAKVDELNERSYPIIVIINDNLPDRTQANVEAFYYDQAKILAKALFGSLPQGTLERLIIELMEKKVSVYRGLTRF